MRNQKNDQENVRRGLDLWLAGLIDRLRKHPVIIIIVALLAVLGAFNLIVETYFTVIELKEDNQTSGPEDNQTSGPEDNQTSGPEDNQTSGPSADEFFEILNDRRMQRSVRAKFIEEAEGKEVHWEGEVDTAERLFTNNPNSLIYLYFYPITSLGKAPRVAAEFPPGSIDVLTARKGDKVRVACKLDYPDSDMVTILLFLIDCSPEEFELN